MLHRLIILIFAAALMPLLAVAQIGSASNTVIKGGFAPGFTTTGQPGVTNGMIIWNPAITQHQVYVNGVWTSLVASSTGTGSGFPLSTNGNAAGFAVTNASLMQASTGDFRVIGFDAPAEYESLLWTTNGYIHAYTPRIATNYSQILVTIANSNMPIVYPGTVVYNDAGTPDDGSSYMAYRPIVASNYQPHTTNSFPWPAPSGTGTYFWARIAKVGDDGSNGGQGDPGADAIGSIRYMLWDDGRGYDYDTNSLWVVSYGQRLWDIRQSSTNVTPGSDTNYWTVAVEGSDGLNGTVIGTNWIIRGAWSSPESGYTTNDVVTYDGNIFYKGPTNALGSGGGTAPLVDGTTHIGTDGPYWQLAWARGVRGVQGEDGNTINTFNFYNYYTTLSTNIIQGEASVTNRMLALVSTNGGTNVYRWVGEIYVGTNIVTATNGQLRMNGSAIGSGTIGSVSSTSTWITAVVLGGTNIVIGSTLTDIPALAGDLSGVDSRLTAVEGAYRPNATTQQARVLSVLFADGSILTTATAGSIAPSNLPATVAYTDSNNMWSVAQELPAGSTIGGEYPGLELWAESDGVSTSQVGTFFGPTNNPTTGIYIGTNGSFGLNVPNSQTSGGNALPANSINLQQSRSDKLQIPGGTSSALLGGAQNIVGAASTYSTVVNGYQNVIGSSSTHSFIGNGIQNSIAANANYSFIGAGAFNSVATHYGSAVVAGYYNSAHGAYSFVGGGGDTITAGGNKATGLRSAIVGGMANTNSGAGGFIGGGYSNKVLASFGTIPGGVANTVSGQYSFAAGSRAVAAHANTFVWSDGSVVSSTSSNQFVVSAANGVYINGVLHLNGIQLAHPNPKTNTVQIYQLDDGTNRTLWTMNELGFATRLGSHNTEGDYVISDVDMETGMAREYNITKLFSAITHVNNFNQLQRAFADQLKVRKAVKSKAERVTDWEARRDLWLAEYDQRSTDHAMRQAARAIALEEFRALPKEERRIVAASGKKPPPLLEPFTEERTYPEPMP